MATKLSPSRGTVFQHRQGRRPLPGGDAPLRRHPAGRAGGLCRQAPEQHGPSDPPTARPEDSPLQNRYTRAVALFRHGSSRGFQKGRPAGLLLLGNPLRPRRPELHPPGARRPGAPGALRPGHHPAPRADLLQDQGRPSGAVQELSGPFFPHLLPVPRPRKHILDELAKGGPPSRCCPSPTWKAGTSGSSRSPTPRSGCGVSGL